MIANDMNVTQQRLADQVSPCVSQLMAWVKATYLQS